MASLHTKKNLAIQISYVKWVPNYLDPTKRLCYHCDLTMNKTPTKNAMSKFSVMFLAFLSTSFVLAENGYLGPTDILVSQDGKSLFVLESDAKQLRCVRIDGSAAPIVLPFEFAPQRMRAFDGGKKLAIIGGGVTGKLAIVDAESITASSNMISVISVGHSPADVAVHEDTAFVANRFGGNISVVDLKTQKETARYDFGREPIALCASKDGNKLLVVGHIPEHLGTDARVFCPVRIIDTKTGEKKDVPLRSGIVNARDVAICNDGRYAFFTAQIGHFEQIPTQVDGGWMNENVVVAVDMQSEEYADTFFLDDFGRGAANPWGLMFSDDELFLAVAHTGSCEISLLHFSKLREILERKMSPINAAVKGTKYPDLPMQLRIPIGPKGVRHLAMHNNTVYASSYFEDAITKCDVIITPPIKYIPGFMGGEKNYLPPKFLGEPLVVPENAPIRWEKQEPLDLMQGISVQRSVARLGPAPVWTKVREGEMLFQDAFLCYEKWQSCISCHPDGRSDCLNWDLLNDGIGNPKNTKSMLLSHETPPSMATGVRANAEAAVRAGVRSILFTVPIEEQAEAMDEYLKSLRPIPSPFLVDGELSESARRGKKLFFQDKTGCSDCHPVPDYTDLFLHDVDTRSEVDQHSKFDTPALIEVWRTAPYLHDGRFETVHDLIKIGKHVNNRGQIDSLTEQEINDLCEFVLSL